MCGIVGVINPFLSSDRKVFEQLLTVDVLRGDHSTGVYNVHSRGSRSLYHKEALPGGTFVDSEAATLSASILTNASDAWVGHNRFATQGAINKDNAHPFAHGDIVLVHNGTLNDESYLPRSFATDSEGIAYALSQAKDAKDVLESLDGAFTLVWADLARKTLNLARNNKRPMYLAKNKHRNTYYFASEKLMLEWILSRNNINHEEVKALPVGKMLSFDMTMPSALKFEETTFTPKVDTIRSFYSGFSGSGWSGASSALGAGRYEFRASDILNGQAKGRYGFTPIVADIQGSSMTSAAPLVWAGHLDEDDRWAESPASIRLYSHFYDRAIRELQDLIPDRSRFTTRTARDLCRAVSYIEFELQGKNGEMSDFTIDNYPECLTDGKSRVLTRLVQTYGTERAFYIDLFKLWNVTRGTESDREKYLNSKTGGTGMAIVSIIAQDLEVIPYGANAARKYYSAVSVKGDAEDTAASLAQLGAMYEKIKKAEAEEDAAKKQSGTTPNKGTSKGKTSTTSLRLVDTRRGATGTSTTSRFKTCEMCGCASTHIVLNQRYSMKVCQTCDDTLRGLN